MTPASLMWPAASITFPNMSRDTSNSLPLRYTSMPSLRSVVVFLCRNRRHSRRCQIRWRPRKRCGYTQERRFCQYLRLRICSLYLQLIHHTALSSCVVLDSTGSHQNSGNNFGIVDYTPEAYLLGDLSMFFAKFLKDQVQKTPILDSINGGVCPGLSARL
jgi:hypothetical protein